MFLLLPDEIEIHVHCRNRTCGEVEVKLKREGGNWAGFCPVCGTKLLFVERKKIKGE